MGEEQKQTTDPHSQAKENQFTPSVKKLLNMRRLGTRLGNLLGRDHPYSWHKAMLIKKGTGKPEKPLPPVPNAVNGCPSPAAQLQYTPTAHLWVWNGGGLGPGWG